MNSGTSFQKRQKEIARMEKRREKIAKRQLRKAEKAAGPVVDDLGEPLDGPPGLEPLDGPETAGEHRSES
jgi:hypothetical protein